MMRCWLFLNFNSIKVQLEQNLFVVSSTNNSEFQFHKGTIRTVKPSGLSAANADFNSIKVQLELTNRLQEVKDSMPFQFHKGTIRTLARKLTTSFHLYFNSIKVQLEHKCKHLINMCLYIISIP